MSNWGRALAGGIAAAAKSGSDALGQQINTQNAIAAEQRAADMRLATQERLMAIEQAMKMRGAERFSKVVKGKLAGQPLEIAPGDPAPLTNEGMTVKPSVEEATQAALDETLASDPEAFMAGTAMMGPEMKARAEERRLAQREKIEADKIASRERIEETRAEARARSDDKRFAAMMARIEAGSARAERAAGGRAGSKSALIQNVEYMRDTLKYSPEQIESYIFDKKTISKPELAAKIFADGKKNIATADDMTEEKAARMADSILSASAPKAQPAAKGSVVANPVAKSAGPAVKALPPGAKRIGTSGGKPVYQTPDGKKFIQE